MEVYIDDMLVKSKEARDHITYLEEMFAVLKKYQMKLNPLKCVFGMSSNKFLGSWSTNEALRPIPRKFRRC